MRPGAENDQTRRTGDSSRAPQRTLQWRDSSNAVLCGFNYREILPHEWGHLPK